MEDFPSFSPIRISDIITKRSSGSYCDSLSINELLIESQIKKIEVKLQIKQKFENKWTFEEIKNELERKANERIDEIYKRLLTVGKNSVEEKELFQELEILGMSPEQIKLSRSNSITRQNSMIRPKGFNRLNSKRATPKNSDISIVRKEYEILVHSQNTNNIETKEISVNNDLSSDKKINTESSENYNNESNDSYNNELNDSYNNGLSENYNNELNDNYNNELNDSYNKESNDSYNNELNDKFNNYINESFNNEINRKESEFNNNRNKVEIKDEGCDVESGYSVVKENIEDNDKKKYEIDKEREEENRRRETKRSSILSIIKKHNKESKALVDEECGDSKIVNEYKESDDKKTHKNRTEDDKYKREADKSKGISDSNRNNRVKEEINRNEKLKVNNDLELKKHALNKSSSSMKNEKLDLLNKNIEQNNNTSSSSKIFSCGSGEIGGVAINNKSDSFSNKRMSRKENDIRFPIIIQPSIDFKNKAVIPWNDIKIINSIT